MNAPTQPPVHTKAMLVSMKVSSWAARRYDKKVTRKVNEEYAASRDAGRYNKHLFADAAQTHHRAVCEAGALRAVYYEQTLPWTDDGWRLLPTANYFKFAEAVRKADERFAAAVDAFIAEYPTLVEDARASLNGLWRAEDYPPAVEVRRKFSSTIVYRPLPTAGDIRVDLPDEEIERIKESVTADVERATEEAMKDAWARLYSCVQRMYGRLTAPKVTAADASAKDLSSIRDSLVASIEDTADILSTLNLTEDPNLEALRQKVLADLTAYDGPSLRTDSGAREDAARKAAAILDAMAPFYGGGADDAAAKFKEEVGS